ncbi:hypothetical protein [Flavobacterium nitrogenifigens]|uniref:Uncharacterized protein n=1 Tax=Flavobacterium nitrogenifigens TaxID=1617283 RepID=A0A521DQ64_9FLAO|nr:hypothetical protein [Flavobacterium nitrogenifigens]KAF2327434.1 hypothetical protein DM397_18580 [Flavobacterium nitrogenifigens]SMO73869.1 hypothetical protein SAMN06265220_103323 [Flavobacterium nitrogenifigens]
MEKKILNSQVADNNSSINNSTNKVSKNPYRKESAIISFIVATLSAIVASYVYDHFLK